MKRVLFVEKFKETNIIKIKLEATKRRTLFFRLDKELRNTSCQREICPLYDRCMFIPSPLKKYNSFGGFCNNLFTDYRELRDILYTYGVKKIDQVIPVKKQYQLQS